MATIEEPVRLSVKVSKRANDWLDIKSKELAISKSALISLAVENYIKETEVVYGLPKIFQELEKQGIKLDPNSLT